MFWINVADQYNANRQRFGGFTSRDAAERFLTALAQSGALAPVMKANQWVQLSATIDFEARSA